MNICVLGLWHLGTVTAACLARAGHSVIGLDEDRVTIDNLSAGRPPLFEPGLDDLVTRGLQQKSLQFTSDPVAALQHAHVLWVTYDTPVDDRGRADAGPVESKITRVFPHLPQDILVLISSQVPVGTTRRLEEVFAQRYPAKRASFAYSPENLRLGKAIAVFTEPDRVVVGVRTPDALIRATQIFQPFTDKIEAMSVESAEMTKHALNAFLALSVTFMNEVALLCEKVGADAKEVERGLKTESRIGPRAYLAPGAAIAGSTLDRDVNCLVDIGHTTGVETHVCSAVRESNAAHRHWCARRLSERLGILKGKKVGVLGLTYKPGTSTLRGSRAVELCQWLEGQGAAVWAHDPSVRTLPEALTHTIHLASKEEVLDGSHALVVATEWPEYREITAEEIARAMKSAIVIDPNRFLFSTLGKDPRLMYDAVGMPR